MEHEHIHLDRCHNKSVDCDKRKYEETDDGRSSKWIQIKNAYITGLQISTNRELLTLTATTNNGGLHDEYPNYAEGETRLS